MLPVFDSTFALAASVRVRGSRCGCSWAVAQIEANKRISKAPAGR
jgi:hypothetical protein